LISLRRTKTGTLDARKFGRGIGKKEFQEADPDK